MPLILVCWHLPHYSDGDSEEDIGRGEWLLGVKSLGKDVNLGSPHALTSTYTLRRSEGFCPFLPPVRTQHRKKLGSAVRCNRILHPSLDPLL